ncbi:MAG: LysM peptidoglycan-binding domain-containing protein [Termitinemataceae bacterium]|nr:MAG: LysM peptidoglycan-binding domain-containing protein [Termitinemataceae bacterium]
MASMIGIKVADGEFYPIVEENSGSSKRLVLTTAHDNQDSVQIDLFTSRTATMEHARYIGTIIVDSVTGKKTGEPSIELLITAETDGEISAEAFDAGNDQHHHLSVSLNTLDVDKIGNTADDIIGLDDEEISSTYSNKSSARKASKAPVIAITAIVICAVLLLLWFMLFRNLIKPRDLNDLPNPTSQTEAEEDGSEIAAVNEPDPLSLALAENGHVSLEEINIPQNEEEPPVELVSETEIPPPPTEENAAIEENTVIEIPKIVEQPLVVEDHKIVVKGDEPSGSGAPVTKIHPVYPVPNTGTTYKLKWGDTLWDVSNVYYRDPWYYKYLANFNRIQNPNKVRAGKTINIPPPPQN